MNSTFIIVFVYSFLPGNALFSRSSGIIVKCSEMTECGKSEQDLASCYYLLVIEIVVKRKGLLPKIFTTTFNS